MKRVLISALGVCAALLVVAGCGGSSSDTTGGSSANSGGSPYGNPASVSTGGDGTTSSATAASTDDGIVSSDDSSDLGDIIVNSDGFTLYDFHKDSGTKSACYGACAKVWPPLLTKASGNPQAQGGADASLLGTTKRTDGTTQVTYAGHPLYTYEGDSKPGDTKGNDFSQFGAQWYALTTAGGEPAD